MLTGLPTRTLFGAGAVSLLALTQAHAEELSVVTYLSATHFGVTEGMQPFMDCVTAETEGAITFSFYPSGQLASAESSLDALGNGIADIAYIVPQRASSKMPLTNVPVLPNMGDSSGEISAAYRKALEADGLLAEELRRNNLTLLTVNQYPPYQVGFTGGVVDTLDGFEGLKLRVIGGSASSTATVLGAVPVELSAADVYIALQRGTVDGVFFPIAGMQAFKLNEVTKAISTNANFGGSMAMVAMNSDTFGAMPEETQQIFLDCGMKSEANLIAYQDGAQERFLQEFEAGGVSVFAFPPEELARINAQLDKTAEEFIARLEARGLPGQAAYDEFRAALGR